MAPLSLCSAPSNSLPEQHLSFGIRQTVPPKPHIFRPSTTIGNLNIIIQQDVSEDRLELVGRKEAAWATMDMIVSLR